MQPPCVVSFKPKQWPYNSHIFHLFKRQAMRRAKLYLNIGILLTSLTSAFATAQLRLSDGTTTIIVTDGAINDGLSTPGAVLYNGAVGSNWKVNVTVGITKPQVGTANQPVLELHTQNISQSAGQLTVQFTEINYTG